MTLELFRKARGVFVAAVELPEPERGNFVREACGDDRTLLTEVLSLLAEVRPDTLADGIREAVLTLDVVAKGARAGPWVIVEEIGRGGMGTVYLARHADETFEKVVALKVVSAGRDTGHFRGRFRAERQILASLSHPNIAMLLDGGTTDDGLPYFVMEHVDGRPIDVYCRERRAPLLEKLRLFLSVCEAVQYAHRNLVVHRDLKPSNILVTKDGVPKLLDFGLARLLTPEAGSDRTATEWRALTPAYASPEQIRGEPLTTLSDVYSLGVLLFVLLTGKRPYGGTANEPSAILHAILNTEALRPRALDPSIPRDVEAVALKALHKDPDQRYRSVEDFAADLTRYLGGHPVLARRGTAAYRAKKFARRHWAGLAAAVLVVASLVAGLLAADAQRRIAERRFDDVRKLARTVMFDLHDAIAALPGSTKAREKLVKTGLQYADALAGETSLNPDLQREIAAAYARLGSVQGGGNSNLGDAEGSRNSYRKAIRIGEVLVASREATDQDRLRLANAYSALGHAGDTFEADCRKAIDIERNVLSRNLRDFDARQSLATAYSCLSTGHTTRGELPKAMDERRSAHRLLEELASEKPDDPTVRRDLALSCKYLGGLLQRNGDLAGALRLYEQAVAIDEKRLRDDPNDALARLDLSFSLGSLSTGFATAEDLPRALEFRKRANGLREVIAAADPADKWANVSFAQGLARLADLQLRSGEPERSRTTGARSLSILRPWLQKDPGNLELKADIAAAEARLALAEAALPRAKLDGEIAGKTTSARRSSPATR